MQNNMFVGNVAKAPTLTGVGDKAVCKFTLIANEYAGKDDAGESRERAVALPMTAFRGKAESLAKLVRKGDQLIVTFRVENNNYQRGDEEVYSYNFVVEEFAFGAPGKEKRDEFASRSKGG